MTNDRAALAAMVIGPERRTKLIERYADGLSLKYGMSLDAARRYATDVYESGAPQMLISIGQAWARREGKPMPGDTIADLLGREHSETVTVTGFWEDMAEIGKGSWLNCRAFSDMWLVSWPDEYQLDDAQPAPPAEPISEDPPPSGNDSEPEFNPQSMWVTVAKDEPRKTAVPDWIPLLSQFYCAVNVRKPEYSPSYANALDIPAYLERHLDDYRAGWPDFVNQWNQNEAIFHFSVLGPGCKCGVKLAAYLGHWLWQRVRSDVVTEYGGTVDDFDVHFEWGPHYADAVLKVAPYVDPEWEIPADHPLAQCDGQESLLDLLNDAA